MCLSVYMGCNYPLVVTEVAEDELGFELATWSPPPLSLFKHVYYLGRKGTEEALECSCLLTEHVSWVEGGLTVSADETYPSHGLCPFSTLQSYVKQAMQFDGQAALVCDDSGGLEQDCEITDYDPLLFTADMIKRDSYMFTDALGGFPWRAYYLFSGERAA